MRCCCVLLCVLFAKTWLPQQLLSLDTAGALCILLAGRALAAAAVAVGKDGGKAGGSSHMTCLRLSAATSLLPTDGKANDGPGCLKLTLYAIHHGDANRQCGTWLPLKLVQSRL